MSRTEAVRRLLLYGGALYRATKEDGTRIILRTAGGGEREVYLL